MDNNTAVVIMTAVAIIAGAALAIVAIRRPKETAAAIAYAQDHADEAAALAERAAAIFAMARDLAASAEQMKDAGSLDKGARLSEVIDRLIEIFPDASPTIARAAAEAGAFWVNRITAGAQPAPQILPIPTTTTTPPEATR